MEYGLKLVPMLKSWRIRLSFSDTPLMYGMVILAFLLVKGLRLDGFLDSSDGLSALLKVHVL